MQEKCPRCGFRAFDGERCSTCDFSLGARIGRRGFISLALGAAAAAMLPPEPLYYLPTDRIYFIDGVGPGPFLPAVDEVFFFNVFNGPKLVGRIINLEVPVEPGRYEVPLVRRTDPLGEDREGPRDAAGSRRDFLRQLGPGRKP